jgi:excinuclease UvrABC ATPase subunit
MDDEVRRREEETQKRIDFILEQQARFAANQQLASERMDRADERWARTEESIRALLTVAEIQAGEIKDLTEAVKAVDERQRQADERQWKADERAREIDERLNALINVVERYISERRNGKKD